MRSTGTRPSTSAELLSEFPQGARTAGGFRPDRFNAEGKIDTESDVQFVFDAGTKGTITVPYDAFVSLAFGRIAPFGRSVAPEERGTRHFPKNFLSKDHYILTIVYQDQSGMQQVVALWLGDDIVQPTLTRLEGRSGKALRFADAQGCAQYKAPEECGYARAGALKGITRIFVDTGADRQVRDGIASEIEKTRLGLEMSERAEDADVILNFRASRGITGTDVGIGAIYVRQDRLRLVKEFAEPGRSEKAVTTQFVKAFVEAYQKDN